MWTLTLSIPKIVFVVILFPSLCVSQFRDIESIRLTGGEAYGNHTGRVEALINGTWGALCGRNFNNAKVVCKTLGFPWAVCGVPYDVPFPLGRPSENSTVWEDILNCNGNERSINRCGTRTGTCTELTQVLCQDRSVINGVATNLTLTEASSSTVTVEWTIPEVPELTEYIRHRVFVKNYTNGSLNAGFFKQFYTRQGKYRASKRRFSVVVHSLAKNTTYQVIIRTDIRYLCSGASYIQAKWSKGLRVTTAEERKKPQLPIRLVAPAPGVDFMGRVEVYYNNTWGTVCDDAFSTDEARVICQSQNFSDALCHVREAGMGQGEGPIWMDNVDCSRGDEVLEDCDFNGWGVNNCKHDADIGVICLQADHREAVQGLTIDRVGATSISLSWDPFSFPALSTDQQYIVFYYTRTEGQQRLEVPGEETSTTITLLTTDRNYNIRIRARYRYSYCKSFVTTDLSDLVRTRTIVTAPDGPPTAFHVFPINNTALEFQWELPRLELRNGDIIGYKLYVQPLEEEEFEIIIESNQTTDFILAGLSPSTVYTCSVLAYTSDDGPRSVYLTVVTPDQDFVPTISGFGVNGNGLDRATVWPGERDIKIHCDVSDPTISVTWFNGQGEPVGTSDRNLRQVSYNNGTTVLQIASNRELSYCDAGVYTCIASTTRSSTHERDFTLLFNDVPPRPSVPAALRITSSAVVLAWDELDCDGGHTVTGFTIRYRKTYQDFLTTVNMYAYNLEPSLRNYTIVNLEAYTSYNFSIRAISDEFLPSEFSLENIITTLAEGPSPPRCVEGTITGPDTVQLSWAEPAEPNGIISSYTVYWSVIKDPLIGKGPSSAKTEQFVNKYSGSTGSAEITVPDNSFWYGFQVSATVSVGNDIIEGENSTIFTIYVPDPAIPAVKNVRKSSITNTSVNLHWDYPKYSNEEILGFQVTVTGKVQSRTRQGLQLIFEEVFVKNFTNNAARITALTPSTKYKVQVAVRTPRGVGRSVDTEITTGPGPASGEIVVLAYFQLMIGPLKSCVQLQEESSPTAILHSAVLDAIKTEVCPKCALSNDNIREEELSCRGGKNDQQIIFRARMVGTDNFSSEAIVEMVSNWVSSGTASLLIKSQRFGIEPLCDTVLDQPSAQDCSFSRATTGTTNTTAAPATTLAATVEVSVEQAVGLKPGDIGGLVIGVIIGVLLLVFIALLVVLLIKIFSRNDFGMRRLQEDKIPEATVSLDNPVYDNSLDMAKEND